MVEHHLDMVGVGGSNPLVPTISTPEEMDDLLNLALKTPSRGVKEAQDTFLGGYSAYFSNLDHYLWEVAWHPHGSID